MPNENAERGEIPLYVKVPAEIQDYLNLVKDETGITKTDAVTLIMEIAAKFISPDQLSSMYDNYMLLGSDGLQMEELCKNSHSQTHS